MKLVFATHNKGKAVEMKKILKDLDAEIITADEAGVTEDIIEDGETFQENALIKARYVAKKTNQWAIADDSGLCVEALNEKPGVYTARWPHFAKCTAGRADRKSPREYEYQTLHAVGNEKNRRAWFESVVALVAPDGREWTFGGRVYGTIPRTASGVSLPGLPYDSVFVPDGHNATFADISAEEKNAISHRGLAFKHLKDFLKNELKQS